MKKRDFKKKFKSAFKDSTPGLKDKIISKCEVTDQLEAQEPKKISFPTLVSLRKITAIAICLAIFITGLSVGMFIPLNDVVETAIPPKTYVHLDVNPSITLGMNYEDKIVECVANNEDGKIVIKNLNLVGMDMDTAISTILSSMYVNGYLTESSNSVLVSVDSHDDERANELLNTISTKIGTVFENSSLECSIIAQLFSVDEVLLQRAGENGISVGKMFLVDKMISALENYVDDDTSMLANLSIKDLNLIYQNRPNKGAQDDPFVEDIVFGEVGGYVNTEVALSILLEKIGLSVDDIQIEEINVGISTENDTNKMFYTVCVSLEPLNAIFECIVDCETGEILKIRAEIPGIDTQ